MVPEKQRPKDERIREEQVIRSETQKNRLRQTLKDMDDDSIIVRDKASQNFTDLIQEGVHSPGLWKILRAPILDIVYERTGEPEVKKRVKVALSLIISAETTLLAMEQQEPLFKDLNDPERAWGAAVQLVQTADLKRAGDLAALADLEQQKGMLAQKFLSLELRLAKKVPEKYNERLPDIPTPGKIMLREADENPFLLRILAGTADIPSRRVIAKDEKTPLPILIALSYDENAYVRGDVAKRRGLPQAILKRFSEDQALLIPPGQESVQEIVASNEDMTPKLLQSMIATPEGKLKKDVSNLNRIVARNINTGSVTLALLMQSSDVITRASVAAHRNATPAILEHLKDDRNKTVQLEVAGNAAATRVTLLALLGRKDTEITARIAANEGISETFIASLLTRQTPFAVRLAIAKNKITSPSTLRRLEDEKELIFGLPQKEELLMALAEHGRTLPETLERLARSTFVFVRLVTAKNPNTLSQTLGTLSNDEASPHVRAAAIMNQSILPDTIRQRAIVEKDPEVIKCIKETLSRRQSL